MPGYGEQSPLAYQTVAMSDKELLLQGPCGQDEPTEGPDDAVMLLESEAGQHLTVSQVSCEEAAVLD